MKDIKIIHYGKIKYFSRYFLLETKEGQGYLKRIYQDNEHDKNSIEIFCTCKKDGVPMHMANYGNGIKYYIKTNKNNRHEEFCSNYKSDEEREREKQNYIKRTKKSYIYEEEGKSFANFHINNFFEKDLKETSSSSTSGKSRTQNRYSQLFSMGELLLSNSWKNAAKEMKRNPKEGNLLFYLYRDIQKNSIVGKGLNLSDIMYVPYKNDSKSLEEKIKGAYHSIAKTLEPKGYPNAKMYILMTIGLEEDIKSQLEDQKGEEFISIKVTEPYLKGEFLVKCKESKFKTEFNKHKVPGAKYYLSAFITLDGEDIVLDKFSIIPTLEDRGFYIESGKEIEFANYLIEQDILFIRPPKSCDIYKEDWNGWSPDFLFLDKKTTETTTIAEVFGFVDWKDETEKKSYKETMEEKIEFFKELEDYSFVYWKANEGYPMPTLAKGTGRFIKL